MGTTFLGPGTHIYVDNQYVNMYGTPKNWYPPGTPTRKLIRIEKLQH